MVSMGSSNSFSTGLRSLVPLPAFPCTRRYHRFLSFQRCFPSTCPLPFMHIVSYSLSAICFLCHMASELTNAANNLLRRLDALYSNEITMSQNPSSSITQFFHASTRSSNLTSINPVVIVIPPGMFRGNLGESMFLAH